MGTSVTILRPWVAHIEKRLKIKVVKHLGFTDYEWVRFPSYRRAKSKLTVPWNIPWNACFPTWFSFTMPSVNKTKTR